MQGPQDAYYIWTYEEDWEVRAAFYSKWIYDPVTDEVHTYEKAPYAQGWIHAESTKTLVGSTESNAENLLKNKKCILCLRQSPRFVLLQYVDEAESLVKRRVRVL